MEHTNEIIERLENLAKHAVHCVGEPRFVMNLDDGIALHKAIDLLKLQEPRVMTPEEVQSLQEGNVVWFEERDNGGKTYIQPMMSNGKAFMIGTHLDINVSSGSLNWAGRRFWTSRPTDEQREAEAWNDSQH